MQKSKKYFVDIKKKLKDNIFKVYTELLMIGYIVHYALRVKDFFVIKVNFNNN